MKLVTDNAFTKAWKISCPTCRIDQPNNILWFKKQCHECEIKVVADKKYTEEDLHTILRLRKEWYSHTDKNVVRDFIKSQNKEK